MSLPPAKLAHQAPFCGTLPSLRSNSCRELHQRVFTEQVRECMDNGYLLSSKKIGSGVFSKVYLAYATRERMKHNPKLFSDLRDKQGEGSLPPLWVPQVPHPGFLYRTSLLSPVSSQFSHALLSNLSKCMPRTEMWGWHHISRILLIQTLGEIQQCV